MHTAILVFDKIDHRRDVLVKERTYTILGWIAVSITLIFSCVWAYWGAFENFHEGWYATSIWENLFMLFFQYLLFTFLFMALALISLRWRRIGLVVHILAALWVAWFFSGAQFSVIGLLIILPFIALGLLYYVGRPQPKRWAYRLIILLPLLIILSISIPQGIKVSKRIDTQEYGMQIIEGNGVTLLWAPRGPGWPDEGISWDEAQYLCRHLSEDGTTVMETEQNIWRLPTVDEAVRSMMLHGENVKGVWDSEREKAVYEKYPDKESPLWDVHSPIIYYWTGETSFLDEKQAYIIVYDGGVYDKPKQYGPRYLSFRAVKEHVL
ncbi:MAG: DUF7670 domain-containing protein [Sphaerochaetaceae bacterium]